MKHPVLVRSLVLGALALVALAAPAQQIWKWRDAKGELQISDRPPPPGTPARSILQSPMPMAAPADAGAASASASASTASAPAGVDPALARRKAELAAKKAEQDKAREAGQAKIKAQQCAAAQEALRTLDSGMRIARVDSKGERVILDDAERAQRRQQAQAIADQACH